MFFLIKKAILKKIKLFIRNKYKNGIYIINYDYNIFVWNVQKKTITNE
jgi:hypothetical protein